MHLIIAIAFGIVLAVLILRALPAILMIAFIGLVLIFLIVAAFTIYCFPILSLFVIVSLLASLIGKLREY